MCARIATAALYSACSGARAGGGRAQKQQGKKENLSVLSCVTNADRESAENIRKRP